MGHDRTEVLGCFDDTVSEVFACLCRLTAGEAGQALDLVVDTYAYLDRVTGSHVGSDIDRDWMIGAAHCVFVSRSTGASTTAGAAPSAGTGGASGIGSLSTVERAVLSLDMLEHRVVDNIAELLGLTPPAVMRAIADGTARLVQRDPDTPVAAQFRRHEVWLDDAMRNHAREAVAHAWTSEQAPAGAAFASPIGRAHPTPRAIGGAPPGASSSRLSEPSRPRRSRVAILATLLVATAVVVAITIWLRPSPPTSDSAGATPDLRNTTTTAPRPDTTSPANARPPETTTPFVPSDAALDTPIGGPDTATPASSLDQPAPAAEPLTGYVIDPPPDGFRPSGGYVVGQTAVQRNHWFELWATPDASRTTGRWFAVVIDDAQLALPMPSVTAGAQRVDVAGNPGLLDLGPDGTLALTVLMPGNQRAEFSAYGLAPDVLITLAGGVAPGDQNRPVYATAVLHLLNGLDIRTSSPTSQPTLTLQAFDDVETSSYYVGSDGTSIAINSGPQAPADLFVTSLLDPPVLASPGFIEDGFITINGIRMVTGRIAGSDHYSFVQWHSGTSTITAVGNASVDVMFAAAGRTRRATTDEWLAQTSTVPELTGSAPAGESGTNGLVEIGSNSTTRGPAWTVRAGRLDGQLTALLDERRPTDPRSTTSALYRTKTSSLPLVFDATQPVVRFDTIDATIVIVLLDQPRPDAKVRIDVAGTTGVFLALVPIPGTTLSAAAYAFSEPPVYSVTLMDVSGSVVLQVLKP